MVPEDGAERRNALDCKYVLSFKVLILVNFLTFVCVCVCVIVGNLYVLASLPSLSAGSAASFNRSSSRNVSKMKLSDMQARYGIQFPVDTEHLSSER
jgi:hypothetical protein